MSLRRQAALTTAVAVATIASSSAAATVHDKAGSGSGLLTAATTTGISAIATDQGCTARAPAGSTLRTVRFRADDLRAMTLPKSALGSRVSTYTWESWHYGFMDNAELGRVELAPRSTCDLNRRHGRVTGFARAFAGGTGAAYQLVVTETHLFFTAAGAADWLRGFVAGLKQMPGSNGVKSVSVDALAGPGSGARFVTIRLTDGTIFKWLLFRRGQLLGSVFNGKSASATGAIDVKATARRLSARMTQRMSTVAERGSSRFDAVMQLSAGLPKAKLGNRYQGLVWDWFFGGCWDALEASSQTSTAAEGRAYLRHAAEYGQLIFCRAMYIPPSDLATYNRVSRVFSGGTLYASANGANGALTQTIRDWQHRAGTTRGGTTYGALSRWTPGSFGDRTVGLRQRAGSDILVRAYIRYGPYLAVANLTARSFTGMRVDVKRWASLLDHRVRALMTTRTF